VDLGMDKNLSFPDLEHRIISNPRAFENFEIFLNVTGSDDSLVLEWSYNTDLFTANTIEQMMGEFELMIKTVIQTPSVAIGSLHVGCVKRSLTTPKPLSGPNQAYPRDVPFFKLISETAQQTPERTAVWFGEERLSYGDLERRSN